MSKWSIESRQHKVLLCVYFTTMEPLKLWYCVSHKIRFNSYLGRTRRLEVQTDWSNRTLFLLLLSMPLTLDEL